MEKKTPKLAAQRTPLIHCTDPRNLLSRIAFESVRLETTLTVPLISWPRDRTLSEATVGHTTRQNTAVPISNTTCCPYGLLQASTNNDGSIEERTSPSTLSCFWACLACRAPRRKIRHVYDLVLLHVCLLAQMLCVCVSANSRIFDLTSIQNPQTHFDKPSGDILQLQTSIAKRVDLEHRVPFMLSERRVS